MSIPKLSNSALKVFNWEKPDEPTKPDYGREVSELYIKWVESVMEGQEVIWPHDQSLKKITKEDFFNLMLSTSRDVVYSKSAILYLIDKFRKWLSKAESRYLRAAWYYYIKWNKRLSEFEFENEKYLINDWAIYSIVYSFDRIIIATNEDSKKSIITRSFSLMNHWNSSEIFDFQIQSIEKPFSTIYKITDTEGNVYFFDISSNRVSQIWNTNWVFGLENYDNDIYHYINESDKAVVGHIFYDKVFNRWRIEKLDKWLVLLRDESTWLYDLYSFDSKKFLFEWLSRDSFEKNWDSYSWELETERQTLLWRFFLWPKTVTEKASR